MRDLELIYEQMYLSNYSILNEGFFDTLRRNFDKLLIPAVGVVVAGLVGAEPVRNAYYDYKTKVTRNAAQQRNVTSHDFGNIFSKDDIIMSYLQKNRTFTITPRQFMISRYGQDWNKIIDNARQQQQNNPSIEFWTNLSDTYLDMPVEVSIDSVKEFKKTTGTRASGAWSPAKAQIYINIEDIKQMDGIGGVGNVMAHEFRHSLQQISAAKKEKGTVPGTKFDMPGGGYVGNPAETGVRIGNLVQSYYNDTGKLITSPQEATKALEKYGFKLNASPKEIENAQSIKIDGDVEQLRKLFYKIQQRSPERAAKFYEILTKQMPGIVYQTYQQSQNTA